MNVAMIGLAFNVVLNDTSHNLTDEIFPSLSLAGAESTKAEDG